MQVQSRAPGQTRVPDRPAASISTLKATVAATGGLLVVGGLLRRSWGGVALALAGVELLRQGVRGYGPLMRAAEPLMPSVTPATMTLVRSTTIHRPAAELYALWQDDQAMRPVLADIAVRDGRELTWHLDLPARQGFGFTTRVYDEVPHERIRWRTCAGGAWSCEGSVSFRPAGAGRGTVVELRMVVSGAMARLPEPVTTLPKALELKLLKRFKALAETGEVPTTKGQPACRHGGLDR